MTQCQLKTESMHLIHITDHQRAHALNARIKQESVSTIEISYQFKNTLIASSIRNSSIQNGREMNYQTHEPSHVELYQIITKALKNNWGKKNKGDDFNSPDWWRERCFFLEFNLFSGGSSANWFEDETWLYMGDWDRPDCEIEMRKNLCKYWRKLSRTI